MGFLLNINRSTHENLSLFAGVKQRLPFFSFAELDILLWTLEKAPSLRRETFSLPGLHSLLGNTVFNDELSDRGICGAVWECQIALWRYIETKSVGIADRAMFKWKSETWPRIWSWSLRPQPPMSFFWTTSSRYQIRRTAVRKAPGTIRWVDRRCLKAEGISRKLKKLPGMAGWPLKLMETSWKDFLWFNQIVSVMHSCVQLWGCTKVRQTSPLLSGACSWACVCVCVKNIRRKV